MARFQEARDAEVVHHLTALGVLEGLEAQSFSRRGLRLLGGVQQVRTFFLMLFVALDAWIVLVHG
jgi:hypothetical protein